LESEQLVAVRKAPAKELLAANLESLDKRSPSYCQWVVDHEKSTDGLLETQ
jgi:hypothetical protein